MAPNVAEAHRRRPHDSAVGVRWSAGGWAPNSTDRQGLPKSDRIRITEYYSWRCCRIIVAANSTCSSARLARLALTIRRQAPAISVSSTSINRFHNKLIGYPPLSEPIHAQSECLVKLTITA